MAIESSVDALAGGVLLFIFSIFAVVYLYFTLAYYSIGKRANLQNPGVAWLSPIVTMFEAARVHWWPLPVLIFGVFLAMIIAIFSEIVGLVFYIALIVFALVVAFVWQWKTFQAVGKPGWWALWPLVSVLGFLLVYVSVLIGAIIIFAGFVLSVVFVGIVAWSHSEPKIG